MKKKLKEIPQFNDEDEEREFWKSNDSTEFIDWDAAESVTLPKLKPSTRTISLRLTESTLEKIKILANKRDVPYQSLIKIFLNEKIDSELKA